MKLKAVQIRNIVFSTLVVIFAALVFWMVCRGRFGGHKLYISVIAVLGIIFGLLGIVLVVLTAKLNEPRMQKIFFILTGGSAAGIPICAILHNVVYGLLFHGKDGDEAAFFILALIVCPMLFVIGTIGSIVTLIYNSHKESTKVQRIEN